MELQKFTDKTVKALEAYFGSEVEIKSHKIYKNNGILLQGICALEKGKNIAPTVYLNEFCRRYEEGQTFGSIISEMIQFMENNRVAESLNVDFFMNYECVKHKLVIRLIHKEKNKELLEQVPYLAFQDLAVVCHCMMVNETIGSGSILIQKMHMEAWKIEYATLFHDAFENSPRMEPFSLLKMSDMMKEIFRSTVKQQIDQMCQRDETEKELLAERVLEKMAKEMEPEQVPMYVLTNRKRYYGAVSLLYPDMLENIGNMLQDDFYVLPSSVHEVIILRKGNGMNAQELNGMIREINRTQVEEEEWLSDHAYLYQRTEKQFISVLDK